MDDLIENGYVLNYGEIRDSDLESVTDALENETELKEEVDQPQNEREEMLMSLTEIEQGRLFRYDSADGAAYMIEGRNALMIYGDENLLREALPGTPHWDSVDEALDDEFDPEPDRDY